MGTLNWTRGDFGTSTDRTIMASKLGASGTYTSTTSATNVTGLETRKGDVIRFTTDTTCWINFNATAAAGTGFYLTAGLPYEFAVRADDAGTVSVIDV